MSRPVVVGAVITCVLAGLVAGIVLVAHRRPPTPDEVNRARAEAVFDKLDRLDGSPAEQLAVFMAEERGGPWNLADEEALSGREAVAYMMLDLVAALELNRPNHARFRRQVAEVAAAYPDTCAGRLAADAGKELAQDQTDPGRPNRHALAIRERLRAEFDRRR